MGDCFGPKSYIEDGVRLRNSWGKFFVIACGGDKSGSWSGIRHWNFKTALPTIYRITCNHSPWPIKMGWSAGLLYSVYFETLSFAGYKEFMVLPPHNRHFVNPLYNLKVIQAPLSVNLSDEGEIFLYVFKISKNDNVCCTATTIRNSRSWIGGHWTWLVFSCCVQFSFHVVWKTLLLLLYGLLNWFSICRAVCGASTCWLWRFCSPNRATFRQKFRFIG